MATFKTANVTKYDAGGSGDNYIKDGYIKTVEKVWIDTIAITDATLMTTLDTVVLARIPAFKKITDIVVHFPVAGTGAGTFNTLNLHLAATAAASNSDGNLGTMIPFTKAEVLASTSAASLTLPQAAFARTVGTTEVGLWAMLGATGGAKMNVTGGTLKVLVRYT